MVTEATIISKKNYPFALAVKSSNRVESGLPRRQQVRCKLTVDLQHVKNRHDFESTNSDGKESNSENKKLHIGVQVYLGKSLKQKAKPWTRSKLVAESEYRTERVVLEYDVEANQYVRVVCATYEEGREADFSVNFYADCESLSIERVPNA